MTKEQLDQWSDKADTYADETLQTPGEYHPDWHEVRDAYFATLVRNAALEEAAQKCEAQLETGAHIRCAQAIRKLKEPTT